MSTETKTFPLVKEWFVGREKHQEEFVSLIASETEHQVLFIHGAGGIGKTWLLQKMMIMPEANQPDLLVAGELIDMYSTANHSVEGVQERIIAVLENILGYQVFKKFRQSHSELQKRVENGFHDEMLSGMRENLERDFIADCQKISEKKRVVLFFDTFERVQRDQVGFWALTKLIYSLPNFYFVVASREEWKGNTVVHSVALDEFTSEEAIAYFETKKLTVSGSDGEVLNMIHQKANGHPLLIELALGWLSGDLLESRDRLGELSSQDFEKALMAPLQEMGQGLFGSPPLDEAVYQTILFMAHFNRRFSTSLLELFMEEKAIKIEDFRPKDILEKLEEKYFFVKTRPDGFIQLHDEMERLVNEYLWPDFDKFGDLRRELARIACQWYDSQIEQEKKNTNLLADLKAEQLVYWIDVDVEKADALLNDYSETFSFTLNNLLVVEIKPEKIKKIPIEYRYRFAVDLGQRARRIYSYERGQQYWDIAINTAQQDKNTNQLIDAFLGLHNCTYQLDLKQSLKLLTEKVLPLSEGNVSRRAKIYYELGFTYSGLQDVDNAIKWYSQAKEAASKFLDREIMPTVLNDMGYAYVMKGDYKRAGYFVKEALNLRRAWLKEIVENSSKNATERSIQEAHVRVGMSYNTLGQIKRFDGDLSAATGAYSEALDIFKIENNFLWQIRALYSRGEAHRRIAATLHEQERKEAQKKFEDFALSDLTRSINLCNQYGIHAEKDTAYRRMGRLIHDQALRVVDGNFKKRLDLLGESQGYFEKALQIAVETNDVLEELENLTELAFLEDDRLDAIQRKKKHLSEKDKTNSRKVIDGLAKRLNKYKDISLGIAQIDVFQHLHLLEEGAYYYIVKDYETALEYYLKGFKGLASTSGYGTARYNQHIDHLFTQLRNLNDADEERRWCQAFMTLWQNTSVEGTEPLLKLAQVHPNLVERMQLYLDTAFMFR